MPMSLQLKQMQVPLALAVEILLPVISCFYFIFDFYSGDLETCRQGATIRLGLRPADLRDGMVFFDSFPVRLYYKDGRLFGQLQTATQIWTVSAPDFRPGLWQRVIHICILN